MVCRFIRIGVILAILFAAAPALAIGYWNVPGNVAQWWGYGWGGGHHSCLVLGPISPKGAFTHNHTRLPYAPQPNYGCYNGCTYNYDFRQSSQFVPGEYQPSPQYPTPTPAASSGPASQTLTPEALPIPEAAPAPDEVLPAPVEP